MADEHVRSGRVWWFAAGYFGTYVPYALLTKAVTSGEVTERAWSGTSVLPIATATSMIAMFAVVTLLGWWRYAATTTIGRVRVPRPRVVTAMSGLATGVIVLTTTLAYAFEGVSILFAMMLMRGGVLLLAPLVDQLTGRPANTIPWWSWVGSLLALIALVVAFMEDGVARLSLAAGIDITLYLAAYFFRLRWMSLHAKTAGPGGRERRIAFFVEEQMVATPIALVGLVLVALLVPGSFGDELRVGFTEVWQHADVLGLIVLLGICSQGTGVFGALVLLEPQENAYTVPVNRASSVLAGAVASGLLVLLFGGEAPSGYEVAGTALVLLAILVLAWPSLVPSARAGAWGGTPRPPPPPAPAPR